MRRSTLERFYTIISTEKYLSKNILCVFQDYATSDRHKEEEEETFSCSAYSTCPQCVARIIILMPPFLPWTEQCTGAKASMKTD